MLLPLPMDLPHLNKLVQVVVLEVGNLRNVYFAMWRMYLWQSHPVGILVYVVNVVKKLRIVSNVIRKLKEDKKCFYNT